jgi:hypothetical protein
MKIVYLLIFTLLISCKNHTNQKKILNNKTSNIEKGFIKIDSIRVNDVAIDYELFFCFDKEKNLVYKIRNQDYSIVFKKKFSYQKDFTLYDCYEINDLTTGLVWNILYDKNANIVYETDKYDTQAIGDTLNRNSVDFSKNKVIIYSNYNNKSYWVNLKKIYPLRKKF